MFDVTLQAINHGVVVNEESGNAQLVFTIAVMFPVGPGQAAPIPVGNVRFPADRNLLEEYSKELAQAAEKLPKKSDLVTAQSVSEAERAAEFARNLRGN